MEKLLVVVAPLEQILWHLYIVIWGQRQSLDTKSLTSGKLASAGLDVHYEEPMLKDDPLCTLDNVILSPHIAGLSFETFLSIMKGAVENIIVLMKEDITK